LHRIVHGVDKIGVWGVSWIVWVVIDGCMECEVCCELCAIYTDSISSDILSDMSRSTTYMKNFFIDKGCIMHTPRNAYRIYIYMDSALSGIPRYHMYTGASKGFTHVWHDSFIRVT